MIVEGRGRVPESRWQRAIDQVAAVNPGTRLRWVGSRRRACWRSDGMPPRLRMVAGSTWDARSDAGSEFLAERPLSLSPGPNVELIVAESGEQTRLIMHGLHAVMDGGGGFHFLHELFRAMRGEPLLGTNGAFSDTDLMRSTGARHTTSKGARTTWLTGPPQGNEPGDTWRRMTIKGPRRDLLATIAVSAADFMHRHSNLPAVIAVPVDLRRHAPGLLSTQTLSSMLLVRLETGEGIEDFKRKLAHMLEQKMETVFPPIIDLAKFLPLSWIDSLLSRRQPWHPPRRPPPHTMLVTNLGKHNARDFSCAEFQAETLFAPPVQANTMCVLGAMGDNIEVVIGMPRSLASNGRLEEFLRYVEMRLG